jgi:hypothetical protein
MLFRRRRKMKKLSKFSLVFSIAVLVLGLSVLQAAKPESERALYFHGDGVIVLQLLPNGSYGEWTSTITGNGTHFGHFLGGGNGTGTFGSMSLESTQGDLLSWDLQIVSLVPNPDGTLTVLADAIITGGTGRFEGATGSFVCVHEGTSEFDISTMTMTLDVSWVAKGRISY